MIPNHRHFKSIDSTHKHAIDNGSSFEDRTVLTADFQSQGRGRLGRTWLSTEKDSLLVSIILKPEISPTQASLITPILAVATCELLREYDLDAVIKWPNDVVIDRKKIGGILAEGALSGNKLSHIVASLGLNIRQNRGTLSEIDRPATSIFVESSSLPDSDEVLEKLLHHFFPLYDDFLKSGFSVVSGKWRKLLTLMGEEVLIDLGEETIEGTVVGFGDDGAIEIKDDKNGVQRFFSGEVLKLSDRKD